MYFETMLSGEHYSWEFHGIPMTFKEMLKTLDYWIGKGFVICHLTIKRMV